MVDSELTGSRSRGNALGEAGSAKGAEKSGVATATSTTEVASCAPTSTPFSRQFTCWWTTSCPPGRDRALRPGSPTLSARYRLGHLFPYLPNQPGYNKRLRRLGPEIARSINYLAFNSPSFCDAIWLLDSTPVPCGQSRETTRRSEFAGLAGYGY